MDGSHIDTLLSPYPPLYPDLQKSYIPVYKRICNNSFPLTNLGADGVYSLRSRERLWIKPGLTATLDLGVSLQLPPFMVAVVFQPACSSLGVRPLRLTSADRNNTIRVVVQNLMPQQRLIRSGQTVAAFHLAPVSFLPIKEDRAVNVFGSPSVGEQARENLRELAVQKFYSDRKEKQDFVKEFEKVLTLQAAQVVKERRAEQQAEVDSGAGSEDLSPLEEQHPVGVTVDVEEMIAEGQGKLREVVENGRVVFKRTRPTGLSNPGYFTTKYAKHE